MSEETISCPACASPYGYSTDAGHLACPECGHEWQPGQESATDGDRVLDANGTELADGDSVIIIKNLPVKGAPKPIKAGTKVKNIKLVDEAGHNIQCKIEGFGNMFLKSEFVRKA